MIYILIYIIGFVLGYATCWFCFNCKVAELEEDKFYWKKQYFEAEKRHVKTLKEADETIFKLSQEKAKLQEKL